MKVCYLTTEYPPGRSGGIGTSLAQRSRALVAEGHEVVVVGLGPHRREDDGGVDVRFDPVEHPPKLGWLVVPPALQRRLRRLVAEEGIDVVVAPDWIGISAGIDPGCPVVVECNGSATYFADETGEPVRRTVRRAERRALRGADVITAVTPYVAERTQVLFDLEHPVGVVRNAVDTSALPEAEPSTRTPDLVLHVGTVVRKKGALDVAEAFGVVHAARPGARLEVVGPDAADPRTGSPSTTALAEELLADGARADVRWRGAVPWTEIGATYARGSVLLVPSHAEAQPLVWIEGMATGLPVVAYDHPWARDLVEHDVHGLLVPPGDVAGLAAAVVALLADDVRRQAMGRAAAAHVRRRFDRAALVPALLASYEGALAGTRRSGP